MYTMNVLLISTCALPTPPGDRYGGLEEVVALLAHGLAMKGHEVTVVAAEGSAKNWRFSTEVEFLEGPEPSPPNPEHLLAEEYKDIIDDFDVVNHHGWGPHPYSYRKDIFHTIHSPYPRYVSRSRSIAVSRAHRDLLMETQHINPFYAYNAIDHSLYSYEEEKDDPGYLLYLARISPEKGATEFIDLCRQLNMKGIVAGDDRLIADLGYVEEVIYRCNQEGIEYRGEVDFKTKVDLLSRARVLVAPLHQDYFEVFGLYFVEAMTSGTPVVATDRGSPKEVIKDGIGGVVASSAEEMPGAVQRAMKMPSIRCHQNAWEFNPVRMADQYLEIYKRF